MTVLETVLDLIKIGALSTSDLEMAPADVYTSQ
jgi:hypothetical protein